MTAIAEKTKSWLKNKYNLALIVVVIAALIIRIYFFVQTYQQPLWWDEAEYMATAEHWAFGVPYDINPQRPPLFQLAAFVLLKLSFGEMGLKFFLVLLPSVIVVVCTYFLGKTLFDQRIALFAAIGTAFMWSYLFWAVRLQPDFISLSLQLLAVAFIWKSFKQEELKWAILAGFFSAFAFYFKISALLIPLIAGLFALWVDRRAVFKKKYYVMIAAYVITLLPFLLWQFIAFGDPIAFSYGYADIGGKLEEGWQPGWVALDYFISFSKSAFFIAFLTGLAFFLVSFLLSFDIKMKSREKRLDPYLFSFFLLLVTTLFYIFFIRGIIEDRWVFIIAPFIYFFAGKGLFAITDSLKKVHNRLGLLLGLLVILFFIYAQVVHANSITLIKKDSYQPIKEASLFLNRVAAPNESILSVSYTQTVTYAERRVYSYARLSPENFTQLLDEKRPTYLLMSILEPHHPAWLIEQRRYNDGSLEIVMPFFNSSISISPQGAVRSLDVKESITLEGKYRFDLIYPQNVINGVFIYKITYLSDNL